MQNAMMQQLEQEVYDYNAQQPKIEMVKIVPAESPVFNHLVFMNNVNQIPEMSDADLAKFVDTNFSALLRNVFVGDLNDRAQHVKLFQDVRFLDIFIQIMVQKRFFDKNEIVNMNTICYHYLTLPDNQKDPQVLDRIQQISKIINRVGLPRLLGLGLSDNLANMLLIARYSDMDLNTVIKRIDFIIITQPPQIMSQRMITDIMRILFDVFVDWIRIFPYYMMDVLPDRNSQYGHWVTDDIEEVDSTLSLSMLEILDNLPSNTIRTVLLNYAETMSIINKPVKFSMKRLSDDYYRINDMVNQLQYREQIYVP